MFKNLKIIFSPRFFIVSVFILGSMFLIKTSYAFTGYTSYNGLVMYNGAAYVGDFQSGDGSVNCITSPSSCPGITWSNGSLDWNQNSRLFGYQNPCAAGYGLSFLQTSPWGERYQCSPSALPPPTLSLSCSASSDSNGVVNLNKIYWVTNLSATDSSGNKVDTSKATYLWKDKGTGNSEISNVNGSLASNSVTVSLNGSTATAQCTLPPPPPLYVACYGSSGASGTNWTAISRSYDYYGNSITPNYSWSDAKTGTTESTNGSANSVTANYTDVYGQKSAAVSKICTPPTGNQSCSVSGDARVGGLCAHPNFYKKSLWTRLKERLNPVDSTTFDSGGSFQDYVQYEEARLMSVAADPSVTSEKGYIVVQYGNGDIVEYDTNNSSSISINFSSADLQIANDAKNKGGVESVASLHSHPLASVLNYGLPQTSVGYPPSPDDLISNVAGQNEYKGANIADYAVDSLGKVWQFSVPPKTALYDDLQKYITALTKAVSPSYADEKTLTSVINYDGGRFANYGGAPSPYSGGDSTQDYLKAVKVSGGIIKPVY